MASKTTSICLPLGGPRFAGMWPWGLIQGLSSQSDQDKPLTQSLHVLQHPG